MKIVANVISNWACTKPVLKHVNENINASTIIWDIRRYAARCCTDSGVTLQAHTWPCVATSIGVKENNHTVHPNNTTQTIASKEFISTFNITTKPVAARDSSVSNNTANWYKNLFGPDSLLNAKSHRGNWCKWACQICSTITITA